MTRCKQRLTGQGSRRWNSKSLLAALWLQSWRFKKKEKKKKRAKYLHLNYTNTPPVDFLLWSGMWAFPGSIIFCILSILPSSMLNLKSHFTLLWAIMVKTLQSWLKFSVQLADRSLCFWRSSDFHFLLPEKVTSAYLSLSDQYILLSETDFKHLAE